MCQSPSIFFEFLYQFRATVLNHCAASDLWKNVTAHLKIWKLDVNFGFSEWAVTLWNFIILEKCVSNSCQKQKWFICKQSSKQLVQQIYLYYINDSYCGYWCYNAKKISFMIFRPSTENMTKFKANLKNFLSTIGFKL